MEYKKLFIGLFSFILASSTFAQAKPFIYAHRGFRGLYPENTIYAMKKAVKNGAGLEIDVMFSKDLKAVVTHDPKLNNKLFVDSDGNKLTGNYVVCRMNYDSISRFKIGKIANPNSPQQELHEGRIALFDELIDSVETYASKIGRIRPNYLVETKLTAQTDNEYHPEPETFVNLLMSIITGKNIQQGTIIESFDPRTLSIIKKKFPEIKVLLPDSQGLSINDYLKTLDFDKTTCLEAAESGIEIIGGNLSDTKGALSKLRQANISTV